MPLLNDSILNIPSSFLTSKKTETLIHVLPCQSVKEQEQTSENMYASSVIFGLISAHLIKMLKMSLMCKYMYSF